MGWNFLLIWLSVYNSGTLFLRKSRLYLYSALKFCYVSWPFKIIRPKSQLVSPTISISWSAQAPRPSKAIVARELDLIEWKRPTKFTPLVLWHSNLAYTITGWLCIRTRGQTGVANYFRLLNLVINLDVLLIPSPHGNCKRYARQNHHQEDFRAPQILRVCPPRILDGFLAASRI